MGSRCDRAFVRAGAVVGVLAVLAACASPGSKSVNPRLFYDKGGGGWSPTAGHGSEFGTGWMSPVGGHFRNSKFLREEAMDRLLALADAGGSPASAAELAPALNPLTGRSTSLPPAAGAWASDRETGSVRLSTLRLRSEAWPTEGTGGPGGTVLGVAVLDDRVSETVVLDPAATEAVTGRARDETADAPALVGAPAPGDVVAAVRSSSRQATGEVDRAEDQATTALGGTAVGEGAQPGRDAASGAELRPERRLARARSAGEGALEGSPIAGVADPLVGTRREELESSAERRVDRERRRTEELAAVSDDVEEVRGARSDLAVEVRRARDEIRSDRRLRDVQLDRRRDRREDLTRQVRELASDREVPSSDVARLSSNGTAASAAASAVTPRRRRQPSGNGARAAESPRLDARTGRAGAVPVGVGTPGL